MEKVWVKREREPGYLTAHRRHQPIATPGPAVLDKESVVAIWGVPAVVRAEGRPQMGQSPSHLHHHQLRLVSMKVGQSHRSQKEYGVLENWVVVYNRLEFQQEFVQPQPHVQVGRGGLVACAHPRPPRPVVCCSCPSCPFLSYSSCRWHLQVGSLLQAFRLGVPPRGPPAQAQWSVHLHRRRRRRRDFSRDQGLLVGRRQNE